MLDRGYLLSCLALVTLTAMACNGEVVFTGSSAGGEGGSGGSGGNGGSPVGGSAGQGGLGGSGGAGGSPGVCGDGLREANEECDGHDLDGLDCVQLGFQSGDLRCTRSCQLDTSSCGICGDDVRNGAEECDGLDLDGKSCISLGYTSGDLFCAPACFLDASDCATDTENCINGVDDDGDGFVDCDDFDCASGPSCQPVEAITGCDPQLCTFTLGSGAHGGDVCRCTIPALRHPQGDDLAAQSCNFFGHGRDLTINLSTAGYVAFTATTCAANPGDSSLAAFDANPAGAATLLACDGDASGESGFCSELTDSGGPGPGIPTPVPASDQLWLQVDEFSPGNYWNQQVDRVIEIELIGQSGTEQGNCADDVDNDADMDVDCDDSDCFADPHCMPRVENINGCDPNYCAFTLGGGPHGGDLCSCTLLGPQHPVLDDYLFPNACALAGNGRDLRIIYETVGYSQYTVTTCAIPGDSTLIIHNGDPAAGGVKIACSGDAAGEPSFCSEVGDSGNSQDAVPVSTPASSILYIHVDEFNTGSFWNGNSSRQIDIELIP